MRMLTLRKNRPVVEPGLTGVARLDRRTKTLTKRLQAGDIAIVDHVDIDRVSAESLVAAGVRGVVNVAPSISGRYPNLGPEILVSAGVVLVDAVGGDVFSEIAEGDVIRIDDDTIYLGERIVAKGNVQTAETIAASMAEARAGLAVQLEAFAANTMEFLRRERDLLLDGAGVPDITTPLEGRHVLIVVRGYEYREDLETLRPYIREYRPVLIAVDGGADALIHAGYRPDIIVGDMDSVTDDALRCGAELVVHAYRDGRAPGLERVRDLGLPAVTFPAAGTSEDVAMLLADDKGASLIVAVGTHATLIEFLDKGRAGMASTFLTRLRVGGKLVDAKGVSRLYRARITNRSLLLLVAATFVTLIVAASISPVGQAYIGILHAKWDSLLFWFREHF
jgi:uncharacterized membrane-anchored protein